MENIFKLVPKPEFESYPVGIIRTNLSSKELYEAFAKGTKILGYNIITDRDYTDNFVIEGWQHFKNFGLAEYPGFKGIIPKSEDELTDEFLETFDFVGLFFFVCKIGNSKFEFEKLHYDLDGTAQIFYISI